MKRVILPSVFSAPSQTLERKFNNGNIKSSIGYANLQLSFSKFSRTISSHWIWKCTQKLKYRTKTQLVCVCVWAEEKNWRWLNKIFPRGLSAWRFAGGTPGASFQYHPERERRAFRKGLNKLSPIFLSAFATNKTGAGSGSPECSVVDYLTGTVQPDVCDRKW